MGGAAVDIAPGAFVRVAASPTPGRARKDVSALAEATGVPQRLVQQVRRPPLLTSWPEPGTVPGPRGLRGRLALPRQRESQAERSWGPQYPSSGLRYRTQSPAWLDRARIRRGRARDLAVGPRSSGTAGAGQSSVISGGLLAHTRSGAGTLAPRDSGNSRCPWRRCCFLVCCRRCWARGLGR